MIFKGCNQKVKDGNYHFLSGTLEHTCVVLTIQPWKQKTANNLFTHKESVKAEKKLCSFTS